MNEKKKQKKSSTTNYIIWNAEEIVYSFLLLLTFLYFTAHNTSLKLIKLYVEICICLNPVKVKYIGNQR